MAEYTIPQLNQMIILATRLGFWDCVKHWTKVRAEIKGEQQ